jgi:hypothetical protein
MKHVYPTRHPADLDAGQNGETVASRGTSREPSLPHEQDESSGSQARSSEQQKDVGRQAYGDATNGSADTDRGPVVDKVYNDKVAPDRGAGEPRR